MHFRHIVATRKTCEHRYFPTTGQGSSASAMQIMLQGDEGVEEQHPRSAPAHHLTHKRTFRGGIAVDGATLARGLRLAEAATVEPPVGIVQEFGKLRRQRVGVETAAAIEVHHHPDDALLRFDAGSGRRLSCDI